ncbi:MAG TPA: hypothetical protein VFQ35_18630, partial [Polyangiaceae bacterium]|nr:hypothetical protein [Polyangiaceae bacterium]
MQLKCAGSVGAPSLALDAESSELGFSAYSKSANAWQFEVAERKPDELRRAVAKGIELGWVFATPEGYRHIGSAGTSLSWLGDDFGPSEPIAVAGGSAIQDVWVDANGVAHFLVSRTDGLNVESSDGTSHHIADRLLQYQRLTPTTPVGVIAAEQGQFTSETDTTFRLLGWELGGEAKVLASVEGEAPVATFAQAEGSRAITFDTYGPRTNVPNGPMVASARRLLFVNEDGSVGHAWEGTENSL